RFGPDEIEKAGYGLANGGVGGPLRGPGVGDASHCGVGGAAGDDDAEAAIRGSLDDGCLGEEDDALTVAGLEQGLGEDSLLPVAPLHGQGGCGAEEGSSIHGDSVCW